MPPRHLSEHCQRRSGDHEVVYDRAAGAELADSLRDRLFRMSMITNTVGAVIVCIFLAFLLPISVPSVDRSEELRLLAIGMGLGAVYLVVTFWIGHRWARRICTPGYEFLEQGRAPTETERDIALRMPLRMTIVPMTFWSLGALLLAGLYATESTELGTMVFDAIFLGGLTTTAMEYLFTERIWRQVVVLALLDDAPSRPVSPGIRARLTTAWALASGVPLLGIVAIASMSIFATETTDADILPYAVTFLALVAVGTGLLATKLVARSVAEPVGGLREALARIEGGDLSADVAVDDGSEIGQLQAGFNRMARGLREQEHLRELFGRQVGKDVAAAALRGDIALGGETREVGVLFVDLIGSRTTCSAYVRCPSASVASIITS
jgi:adenylate cyclase